MCIHAHINVACKLCYCSHHPNPCSIDNVGPDEIYDDVQNTGEQVGPPPPFKPPPPSDGVGGPPSFKPPPVPVTEDVGATDMYTAHPDVTIEPEESYLPFQVSSS